MRQNLVIGTLVLSCGCGGSPDQVSTGAGASSGSTSSEVSSGAGASGGGGGGACSGLVNGPGDFDEAIDEGGTSRTFRVHVPPSYSPAARTSVVLVFHGYTQTSSGIEDISQMTPVSDAHGFIAVYPQGLGNSWNAGSCCGSSANAVDDVAFVGHMLDKLEAEYCVDPKRIYATGLSNGGMLSHRLACEMSDRIAAIGAVAGTLAIDGCAPTRPVAVMHVHGTADFVVPYNGGNLGGAKSVPETIGVWTGVDGCADGAIDVFQNGDASCEEYQRCDAGVAVRVCTIDQGGHQWPGGKSDFLGKLSLDLAASEEMVKFFEGQPLP